jgi:diphthamide biosynthesis methyltransferase
MEDETEAKVELFGKSFEALSANCTDGLHFILMLDCKEEKQITQQLEGLAYLMYVYTTLVSYKLGGRSLSVTEILNIVSKLEEAHVIYNKLSGIEDEQSNAANVH